MKFLNSLFLLTVLLSSCSGESTVPKVTPEEAPSQAEATLSHTGKGFAFSYPATWMLTEESETSLRVESSEPTDGCDAPWGMVAVSTTTKDPETPFSEFSTNSEIYDANGGLGQLGGAVTETMLGGRPAYHYESSGWESRCEDDVYLVEIDEETYLRIATFTSHEDPETDGVQSILDSLKIQ